jgi:N4-gp56 family major capsid protein
MPTLTTAFSTNPLTAAIIERYMSGRLLSVAKKNTVFWNLGNMVTLPKGESRTITFQQFQRIPPPRTKLSEGITPPGSAMTATSLPAIMDQWGDFVTLTDVAEMTVRYTPSQRAIDLLGLQAAETIDREVQRVLMAGINVFFPASKTRTTLANADVIDLALLRKIRAKLRGNGAPYFEGSKFALVVDTFVSADIQSDTVFIAAAEYSNLSRLNDAELGTWGGFRIYETNFIPVLARNTAFGWTYGAVGTETFSNVAGSGEVFLPNGVYTVTATGFDFSGFEVHLQNTTIATVTTAGGNQVIKVILPALPTGVSAYNIYVSTAGGGAATMTLQAENLAPGTYFITGGAPVSANAFTFTASGSRNPQTQPAVGVNVHFSYAFGDEFYSVVSLDSLKTTRTPAGAQKGDELDQRRSFGWKVMFKSVITQPTYGFTIESGSINY